MFVINVTKKTPYPKIRGLYNLATSYSPRAFTQVPLALKSLTSVFGMGTGVTSSPSLPDYICLSDNE